MKQLKTTLKIDVSRKSRAKEMHEGGEIEEEKKNQQEDQQENE